MSMDLNHWHLNDEGAYSHLIMDVADSSVNVLSAAVMTELEAIVEHLEQNPPAALLLSSAKPAGFLAGADVSEFLTVESDDALLAMLQRGQMLFLRIELLPFLTVAAIHGHCLGGGLELALACDYRVADEDNSCKLGLPEVKLGIHPGYGGGVRLPRLISSFDAINMMLAGKMVNGKAAKKMGLVDVATQQRHLLAVATKVATGQLQLKRQSKPINKVFQLRFVRSVVAKIIRKKMQQKANPKHYPAPYHLLDFWENCPADDEAAYLAEAKSVLGIAQTAEGQRAIESLLKIFTLDKQFKAKSSESDFKAKHIHVVGAGVMGGDIAAWCALKGFTVTLQDASYELIGPAIERAAKLFKKRLKQPHLVRAALDRLMADPNACGVAKADVVIEAITERLEAKQGLFATLEPQMKATAILATNTSSIALEQLCEGLERPERLVGIHFFNPVAMMALVEVVRGQSTSDSIVNAASAFVVALGKLPLEVKSSPGFLVNRVLMTYMAEAMRLYEEGVAPEKIDQAAVAFGMPVGPMELADVVGLDICQAVAQELISAFGGEDSKVLQTFIDKGQLGRKSGQGFYQWHKGKAIKANVDGLVSDELKDRLVYAFLNECVACLGDSIVADADAIDIGLIFGTGFAPFRGGPVSHIKREGLTEILARFTELETQYGPQFKACEAWQSLQV